MSLLLFLLLLILIVVGGEEVDCHVNHDWIQRDNEAVIEVQSFPVNGNSLFEITFHGMFAEEGELLVAPGWCVDLSREIYSGTYIADVFSSYAQDYHLDAVDRREYLRHLTWLLNHYQPGDVYEAADDSDCTGIITWADYQGAIWTLMDDDDYSSIVGILDPSAPRRECIVQGLAEKAMHATITDVDCQNPHEEMAVLLIIDDMDDMILHQVMIAQVPVRATGICDCDEEETTTSVGAYGDPHVKMWNGDRFDFHGICDLVLLKNSHLDLDIHIRTSPTREWSFISAVAVRLGNATLEVQGRRRRQNDDDSSTPQYWLNQVECAPLQHTGITWRRVNSKQDEFVVELEGGGSRLVVKTFWEMVRVDLIVKKADVSFGSVGLMGSYNHGGARLARDDSTLVEDTMEFGLEWQVLETEAKLFHLVRGPQAPLACQFPQDTKSGRRRRLTETAHFIPE